MNNNDTELDLEKTKKVNTRLITPLIVLGGTAVIAVFTFFKRYPVGDWFVIVFVSVIIFMIIGLLVEKMLNNFLDVNYEKIMAEKAEAERLEEEARAAMEAEGGEESVVTEDEEGTPQF